MNIRRWFALWFLGGVCLSLLWACNLTTIKVDSFANAERVLREQLLPKITIEQGVITDVEAQRYNIDKVNEPLPQLEDFPLYAAQPATGGNTSYIEIFSSSEKANAKKDDERWLVDVAEAFNAQKLTTSDGKTIQVGIRNVPSGTAVRLLAAKAVRPVGFSPSNQLWLEMLKQQGVNTTTVAPRLVPNTAGFVVADKAYQELAKGGAVTFDRLVDAIISGKITVGYPNPYASSTALNLLYSLFWRSAGHQQNSQPLTVAELQSPQVNSVFDAFQKQVLITTLTTLDLKELFIRDQNKLQAFPLEYQSFHTLKKLPGFEKVHFIPFGIPHNNPLVGFPWNTSAQKEALKRFAEFASAPNMQQLAAAQGFTPTEYLNQPGLPPIPSGEVLLAAQSYWKQRKDSGRTVYLMMVIDTSGSMDGERLTAVKDSLRLAASQINQGNYVGITTFSDAPKTVLPLAAFDTLQHKRLLAAADALTADGGTAMYDGMMAGLAELMARHKTDPNGRYYLLLLSDGEVNRGLKLAEVKDVLAHSGVRFYPISYGAANQQELQAIAAIREATVKSSEPKKLHSLFKDLLQTNL
jgi:Ca-activated chloride channel family protein